MKSSLFESEIYLWARHIAVAHTDNYHETTLG